MEDNPHRKIDPVGVELALGIYSALLSTVAFLHMFEPQLREIRERKRLRRVRDAVLAIQNSIDDLLLTFARAQSYDVSLDGSLSINETMLDLKERDFHRWRSIRDAIERNRRELYDSIDLIRREEIEEEKSGRFASELVQETDHVLLSMGEMSLSQFVLTLRELAASLDDNLAKLTD